MKTKERFSIVEYSNRSGTTSFRVTGRKVTGERVRKNFESYEEAIGEKSRLELEATNQSVDRVSRITSLNDAQLTEAEAAFRKLGERSLMDAVDYFLSNYREPVTEKSLEEALEEFLADKQAENCRPLTLQNLKVRISRFVKKHPKRNVSDIDADKLRNFIHQPGLKPVTKDNNRRALSSFFTWAERRGFCKPSPMREIRAIRVDRDEPTVMTVEQINKLLSAASGYREGRMLPYVAISLFAAIRPNELKGLQWEHIDLEEKLITITSANAKMRQRRLVKMSDNLVAWLAPYALKGAEIHPKNFRRDFDTIKALAGFDFTAARINFTAFLETYPEFKEVPVEKLPKWPEWTPDIMRHTAISYHLAKHEHEGKTAAWAGNSPDIIQKHYKGLVKPKHANWFWGLAFKDLADCMATA